MAKIIDVVRFQKWVQRRDDGGVHATPAECFNGGYDAGAREERLALILFLSELDDFTEGLVGSLREAIRRGEHHQQGGSVESPASAERKMGGDICKECSGGALEISHMYEDMCPHYKGD